MRDFFERLERGHSDRSGHSTGKDGWQVKTKGEDLSTKLGTGILALQSGVCLDKRAIGSTVHS